MDEKVNVKRSTFKKLKEKRGSTFLDFQIKKGFSSSKPLVLLWCLTFAFKSYWGIFFLDVATLEISKYT